LQGEFQGIASYGTSRIFPGGSILKLEDTCGKEHSARLNSETEGLVFTATQADTEEI